MLPKVTTCSAALSLASAAAKPKAGILAASSASAFATVGVLPVTPVIQTTSPLLNAPSAFASNLTAPSISPMNSPEAVTLLNVTLSVVATA